MTRILNARISQFSTLISFRLSSNNPATYYLSMHSLLFLGFFFACASLSSGFSYGPSRRASFCRSRLSLSAKIVELNDSNFRQLMRGEKPVLIDACAPWCGPCKLIEPVLDRCAEKWANSLVVARYNVETRNPDLKLELLLQGVMPKALPSLILFVDAKAVTKRSGVIVDDQLDEFLRENIASSRKQKQISSPPRIMTTRKSGFVSLASRDNDDYMLKEI